MDSSLSKNSEVRSLKDVGCSVESAASASTNASSQKPKTQTLNATLNMGAKQKEKFTELERIYGAPLTMAPQKERPEHSAPKEDQQFQAQIKKIKTFDFRDIKNAYSTKNPVTRQPGPRTAITPPQKNPQLSSLKKTTQLGNNASAGAPPNDLTVQGNNASSQNDSSQRFYPQKKPNKNRIVMKKLNTSTGFKRVVTNGTADPNDDDFRRSRNNKEDGKTGNSDLILGGSNKGNEASKFNSRFRKIISEGKNFEKNE